jgi:hypothetical protein
MRRAVPSSSEDEIKAHVETYQQVQQLVEKKKVLLAEYKEKKTFHAKAKVDSNAFSKLNGDLDLGLENDNLNSNRQSVKQYS